MNKVKRAITLAGGGPAAGLHIGALKRFEEAEVDFDVWALSCIGAWVAAIYNQFDKGEQAERTEGFFRQFIFRDDLSYAAFPINHVFGPDLQGNAQALLQFLIDPESYRNLILPNAMLSAMRRNFEFVQDPTQWNQGDLNNLVLENLAANPISRFLTSMLFLSGVNGLTKIYYPDSNFLKRIKFDKLREPDKPFMYHNAWNLTKRRLELFANHPRPGYKQMSMETVCACSALPYIEETIDMDGDTYCEGALVETVSFARLLEDHPELDEVWISRIVADDQIREPRDLTDALGNLCMLFAANLGEDDIKLFRYHAKDVGWKGKIIELKVSSAINYDWSQSNLDHGVRAGYDAADVALKEYLPEPKVAQIHDLAV